MSSFGARLAEATSGRGQLCVGIDPHPELLAAWGLPADADGLRAFCDVCVRALSGFAIVKPQVAFFEAYGAPGFAVLADTITALRSAGVLVLADAKRGDIGSTMAAYATAWLGPSPLAADAVTASPYLGFGSLTPLLERADERDGGVFVLAATSNPEGATVQGAVVPGTDGDGRSVAQSVVDEVARCNRESQGPLGSVGVVVGATLAEVPDLAEVRGPVLMPGIGAQGGRLDGLSGVGGAAREWLLPAVSREVLRAGPDAAAVRAAGERLRDEMARLAR